MGKTETAMLWTGLVSVITFFAALLLLNCGTPERMCISADGVQAAECLKALKGEH